MSKAVGFSFLLPCDIVLVLCYLVQPIDAPVLQNDTVLSALEGNVFIDILEIYT